MVITSSGILSSRLAYWDFTKILRGFASAALGKVTVSTPFLHTAVTLLESTGVGREMMRLKLPSSRSLRW
jgi:hypothetical protein